MALVIGIDQYKSLPKLQKAVGDAAAMARALQGLGFEVTQVIDANRQELNIAISKFASRLNPDDLAYVHFSGHGVEIDGDNYLLPTDVPKPENGQKGAVKYEGIGLRRLVSQITDTGVRTRVFVLDACRENPFEQSGVRAIGSSRGLARIEAPAGTFIMYSAGYRQVALDRLGPDDSAATSVFTRVLLDKLQTPGKPIAHIARAVRNEVQMLARSAGHEQRPAYYDELSSKLVLRSATALAPTTPQPTSPSPGLSDAAAIELAYWSSVKDSKNIKLLQSYLDKYPEGQFSFIANVRISELSEPAAPQAKAIDTVALQSPPDEQPPQAGSSNNLSRRELALRIQTELNRVGCNAGNPDGSWGARSRRALRAFSRHSSVKLASLTPSKEVLGALQKTSDKVCPIICGPRRELKGGRCVAKTVKCSAGKRLNSRGRCVINRDKREKADRKKARDKQRTQNRKDRRKTKTSKKSGKRCGWCGHGDGSARHWSCDLGGGRITSRYGVQSKSAHSCAF